MRVLVELSQEELGKLGEIMGNEIEEAEDAAYAIHELIASAEYTQERKCANCGQALEENAKYCQKCGKKVE